MSVITRSRATTLGGLAVVGVSALVLAGCAGGGSDDSGDSGDAAGPVEDMTLTIGTALPQTGNLAFLGPPEEAGVAYAAAQINEVSDTTGLSMDVVYGDSGDTDNKAYETEIPRLLGEDVSAIIGAASSGVSLQFIDQGTAIETGGYGSVVSQILEMMDDSQAGGGAPAASGRALGRGSSFAAGPSPFSFYAFDDDDY